MMAEMMVVMMVEIMVVETLINKRERNNNNNALRLLTLIPCSVYALFVMKKDSKFIFVVVVMAEKLTHTNTRYIYVSLIFMLNLF
jgi:hypothetical protein